MSFLTGYVLGMTLNKNSNGSYHERDFEKEQLKIKCQELENRNADLCKTIERLQEQLDELQNENNNLCNDIVDLNLTIGNKEKQLGEANEVIKTTNRVSGNIDLSQLVYEDRRKIDGITMQTGSYLEKWGVK